MVQPSPRDVDCEYLPDTIVIDTAMPSGSPEISVESLPECRVVVERLDSGSILRATRKKPYNCPICLQCFPGSLALLDHKKSHAVK